MLRLEFLELQITEKDYFKKDCGCSDGEIEKIQKIFGRRLPSWFMLNNLLIPQLRRLELRNCFLLERLPPLGFPIVEVMILEDPSLISFPEWIFHASPSLKKLIIDGSFELLQKCFRDGPYWPIIQRIPYVRVQGENHYIQKSPTSYSTGLGCSSYDESLQVPRNDTRSKFDYLVRHWGSLE